MLVLTQEPEQGQEREQEQGMGKALEEVQGEAEVGGEGGLTQEGGDRCNGWWQAGPGVALAGRCARLGGPGGHLGSAFGPRGQGGPGSLGGPGGCWGANPTS